MSKLPEDSQLEELGSGAGAVAAGGGVVLALPEPAFDPPDPLDPQAATRATEAIPEAASRAVRLEMVMVVPP